MKCIRMWIMSCIIHYNAGGGNPNRARPRWHNVGFLPDHFLIIFIIKILKNLPNETLMIFLNIINVHWDSQSFQSLFYSDPGGCCLATVDRTWNPYGVSSVKLAIQTPKFGHHHCHHYHSFHRQWWFHFILFIYLFYLFIYDGFIVHFSRLPTSESFTIYWFSI